MPLIFCPKCGEVTYASPVEGESFQCIRCGSVFSRSKVQQIKFPDEVVVLSRSFAEIVADFKRKTQLELFGKSYVDSLNHLEPREIAREFIEVIKCLCRPSKIMVLKWMLAEWNREDRRNKLSEKIQEHFEDEVRDGYYVLEITEPNKEKSIFLAALPEDVAIIKKALEEYLL